MATGATTIQDLNILNPPIGKGSYGEVYKALDKIKSEFIAVKWPTRDLDHDQTKRLWREIHALQHIRHVSLDPIAVIECIWQLIIVGKHHGMPGHHPAPGKDADHDASHGGFPHQPRPSVYEEYRAQ